MTDLASNLPNADGVHQAHDGVCKGDAQRWPCKRDNLSQLLLPPLPNVRVTQTGSSQSGCRCYDTPGIHSLLMLHRHVACALLTSGKGWPVTHKLREGCTGCGLIKLRVATSDSEKQELAAFDCDGSPAAV